MTVAATPQAEYDDALDGFNVMLMGPAGTGKTRVVATLAEAGMEVFYLALENGLESLKGYWKDQGKEVPPNVHWHILPAPKTSFADMIDSATKINTMNLESLAKMSDPKRTTYDRWVKMLTALNDFPDDRTGQKFGGVDTWTPNRVLVIDALTGMCNSAMGCVIGGKPVRSQSDWGIAQDMVERLLRALCDNCPCSFVLLAHVERETDAVLGGVKIMASALGKALAPKLPSMFSDVVLTVREGTNWYWDTGSPQADVKGRNLPFQQKLAPDFRQIVEKWVKRGGKLV